jgi:gliding motility-associated-like protein
MLLHYFVLLATGLLFVSMPNAIADDKRIPEIINQVPLIISEDQSLALSLDHFIIEFSGNDDNPGTLTLQVGSGDNYSVSGTTITPTANFNGILSVPVIVYDGENTSNTYLTLIQITAVNDPPVITGQVPLQTNEEQPITLTLSHFTVDDPDNIYPLGFSLSVSEGSNYSVSGTTVTPAENFNGILNISVTVNDGVNNSEPFTAQITVNAVNDIPVITGHSPLQTNEDQAMTLDFSHLIVHDADNSYPTGFSILIANGSHYTVSGNTLQPASNFSGTLSVSVQVSDGINLSEPYTLSVNVIPVNDPPVITGQTPLTINEDQPLTIQHSHLTVTDPDNTYPNDFSITVIPGTNYSVTGTTITPATGFSGTLTPGVTVSDGTYSSAPYSLQIQVTAINNAPVITGQIALQTKEDEALTIQLNHLMVSDPDNNYPDGFSMSVEGGSNYTVSGATVTPSLNFNGTLSVNVSVNDGANSSAAYPLQITVLPVNDTPLVIGQHSVTSFKDKPITIDIAYLKISDPDNTYPTDFAVTVLAGDNYVFTGNAVTPMPGFLGTLTVNVTITDGINTSTVFPLKIQITTPPNIAPKITGHITLTTFENQSLTLQLSNLLVEDPDNIFPDDFTLTVMPGINYSVVGTTITPAKNFSGNLMVTVTVSDKAASSTPYNLPIQVIPVSTAPLITSQTFLSMKEDSIFTIQFSHLIVIDTDNTYPDGFTLTVLPGSNYSILTKTTVKPDANFTGYLTVPVLVNDGVNNSAHYNLMILVDPVNDPPIIANLETEPILYGINKGPISLSENIEVTDIDDDNLFFAEIGFTKESFASGDTLLFTNTTHIRGLFDYKTGILTLIGKASVTEYQEALRSIQYDYRNTAVLHKTKTVYITLNDGKNVSTPYERQIDFLDGATMLDIPEGFTPNEDGSNDFWSIRSHSNEPINNIIIRVYNKRGVRVYESNSLHTGWDGRYDGTLLPADTYFYTIDINTSNDQNRIKGIVVLLR